MYTRVSWSCLPAVADQKAMLLAVRCCGYGTGLRTGSAEVRKHQMVGPRPPSLLKYYGASPIARFVATDELSMTAAASGDASAVVHPQPCLAAWHLLLLLGARSELGWSPHAPQLAAGLKGAPSWPWRSVDVHARLGAGPGQVGVWPMAASPVCARQ